MCIRDRPRRKHRIIPIRVVQRQQSHKLHVRYHRPYRDEQRRTLDGSCNTHRRISWWSILRKCHYYCQHATTSRLINHFTIQCIQHRHPDMLRYKLRYRWRHCFWKLLMEKWFARYCNRCYHRPESIHGFTWWYPDMCLSPRWWYRSVWSHTKCCHWK